MTSVVPNIARTGRYTPTEAARMLCVDRRTIYRAMSANELPWTLCRNKQKRYIKGTALMTYYLTH